MPVFEEIFDYLGTLYDSPEIAVPAVWKNKSAKDLIHIRAHDFFRQQFAWIKKNSDPTALTLDPIPFANNERKGWIESAVTYNLLVRFFSAFDHDQDGKLGEGISYFDNSTGIRESGTLLKTIALLPYLKNLGVNTIHLLPITPIGLDGRKGDLGSPYAIKNHFEIDPTIVDPFIPFSGEKQLAALIEACHGLGMRVVLEFILRTTAKDADWVKSHPDWYYWIKDNVSNFGPPQFTKEDLKIIKKVPAGKGRYIEPNEKYRDLFTLPPDPKTIRANPNYQGEIDKVKVRTPSAFADWPPDDPQPPWTDVTYLKFYCGAREKNFNYIAYNTVRYYDPELEKEENIHKKLWQKLTGLIPYYQQKFGIDGVMIDMGHALPFSFKKEMLEKARKGNEYFSFWDEKFNEDKNTSTEYNAIIGNTWYLASRRNGYKRILKKFEEGNKLHFFACAETHNSPRFGYDQPRRKKQMWLLLNLLDKGMPFIHQGFELNEWIPVNTGLNIGGKLSEKLKKERLPLFNKTALNWQDSQNSISFISYLNRFRKEHLPLFSEKAVTTIHQEGNSKVVAIRKKYKKQQLIFLFNFNHKRSEYLKPVSKMKFETIELDKYNYLKTEGGLWTLSKSGFAILKTQE